MSTTAHWAGLTAAPPGVDAQARSASSERPVVRTVAFAALALYGIVRWATLMTPAPAGRLLGLVAVAVGIGALGPVLSARSRPLALVAAVVAVIFAFPLSGVPLAWVLHVRIAVIANAIGQGLGGLPRVLVPYSGSNESVRMVITMGAAVLLLDAGLLLAFSPASFGDLRRGAVALPLLALAVVPSTLLRPSVPYLQGALLFGLLAAFLWGERVHRGDGAAMVVVCSLAAVAALFAAPALDRHRPWIDPQSLAGGLAPTHLERFDWSQRYGPLNWPRTGHAVLAVQATHPQYWKAEDLDLFNGHAWVAAAGVARAAPSALLGVSPRLRARWTQKIRVTLGSMSTSTVIAAGAADAPVHAGSQVLPGASPGTWVTGSPLGPGDSYTVIAYTPRPSPKQLEAAGSAYPRQLAAYRTIDLPLAGTPAGAVPVAFAPFHSALAGTSPVAGDSAAASPYGQAYGLSTRLAQRANTPYAFIASVERYLSRGYTYDETPPQRRYPLESFLFQDKLGYCQQFAGAMALLLRMGGIPARVAAGFTAGSYDSSSRRWVVSDLDAHAWVEAWFPRYGWVRFDPTPGAAPARGGRTAITNNVPGGNSGHLPQPPTVRRTPDAPTGSPTSSGRASPSPSALPFIAVAVLLLILVTLAALAVRCRRTPTPSGLLAELERALARAGRPLSAGTTLAGLEDRFRASPEASEYVRAIRVARFGGADSRPTAQQRRALRAQLRAGLGLAGALRALWALPPGWPRRKPPPRRLRGAYTFSHG